jgi:CHAD domain-containing protein
MAHATTVIGADLAKLIRRERDSLVRHLPAARKGDVRGVHRARVASRRLREILPVAEAALGQKQPGIRRDLRRLTRALGPVRELDVTRGVLADLWKEHGWPQRVLNRVDRLCASAREARRSDMFSRLSRSGASDLPRQLSSLATAVGRSADEARGGALLASRLRQRSQTMKDAIGVVGTLYVPAPIHAVRIAGKKLRYSLEIGQATAGLKVAVPLKELKTLQELLGSLNDRLIVQHWLQTAAAQRGVGRQTIRILDDCQVTLEAECRERHARFLRRVPRLVRLVEVAGRDVVFNLVTHRPKKMRETGETSVGRRGRAGARKP